VMLRSMTGRKRPTWKAAYGSAPHFVLRSAEGEAEAEAEGFGHALAPLEWNIPDSRKIRHTFVVPIPTSVAMSWKFTPERKSLMT